MVQELRVILADDDPNYLPLVQGALRQDFPKVQVFPVSNREELTKLLGEGGVDLVLTECLLTWATGAQVMAAVRSARPEVPVIFLTSAAHEAVAAKAVKDGLEGFVLKYPGYDLRLRELVKKVVERAESAVRAKRLERRMGSLLSRLHVGVFRSTAGGRLLEANPAFLELLGFQSLAEAQALGMNQIYARPEDRAQLLRRMAEHSQVKDWEVQLRRADGKVVWVNMNKTLGSSPDGEMTFDGIVEDVTEKREAAETLRDPRGRFALAASGASDGLWDWNLATNEVFYSPRFCAMLGLAEGELGPRSQDWFDRILPEDRPLMDAAVQAHLGGANAHLEVEYRIRHRDGNVLWMLCRGVAERDASGKPTRIAGSQTDISERKTSEEQLRHDTLYDGLSGLPNRFLFMERLQAAIDRTSRAGSYSFGVLVMDLDRFQTVNDSLGHVIGDQLLIALAHRLKASLRPGDMLSRLGGDEFAVLLEDIREAPDAIRVSERIHKDLEAPFQLCGHEIFATASVGIALSAGGYQQAEVMLRDADTAMYRAKAAGRGRQEVFHASMHARAVTLLKMEGDLRRALERHELRIHYQPIVALDSWKIAGFEALLRWQHPDRGLVMPEEFIPLAEDTGLIVPIARWVLKEACRQVSSWQGAYPMNPPVSVSVNLSSKNLAQPDLLDAVGGALTESGLRAGSLGLEITESALIENAEHAVSVLSKLRALNIRMHIDDFGTGYSSLSYLHQFPVDSLKIDRSFVNRIPWDGQNAEIVRTIMALARNLGLTVIAEGVETREQAEALRELQCQMAQGFFFHKPLEGDQVKSLLRAKSTTYLV